MQEHWGICEVCTRTRLSFTQEDSYTHMKYRMARQRRDDCSQCATGLVVLLENPGALGLILAPLHPPGLPQPASLCLVWHCFCCAHTHKHTQSTLSPYQKRKAALFAQTVSCSNFRCEQLVFRPARGIFTLLMSPERS